MPQLPLPANPSVVPSGGDLPVTSAADVLAVLPSFMQPNVPAPVRDAIVAAILGIHLRHQELSAYAAAQCDVLRATDFYLDALLEERGFFRQVGETDANFRARAVAVPDLVSPSVILAAVNAILAAYTTVQAQYLESALDRLFIFDGTQPSTLRSFVGPVAPQYLDRLYRDDSALNGNIVRPNADPGGSWIFGDEFGRMFVLRIPVVADSDIAICYFGFDAFGNPLLLAGFDATTPELGGAEPAAYPALSGTQLPPTAGGRGLFIGDGTNTSGAEQDGSCATFLWTGATSAIAIYQAIANGVDRIKAHSIRWQLFVDSNLTS